jgi:hypothetical protein
MAGAIFGILLVGLIIFLALYFSERRKKAVAAIAPTLGLTFAPGTFHATDPELAARSKFGAFGHGQSRSFGYVLHGHRDGVEIRVFDYSYSVPSGTNQQTIQATMALLSSPKLNLPGTLDIHPENVFSKIGAKLGAQDVDLADFPEFSKRFVVKADSPEIVPVLIDSATAAFFVAHPRLTVQVDSPHLLAMRGWRTVKPTEFPAFLDEALGAFRHLSAGAARVGSGQATK